MRITVITTTRDRPAAFALCAKYVRRQTRQPDRWIVVDDGDKPARPGMDCDLYVRRAPSDAPQTLCANLIAGLEEADGDHIYLMEDDDWYHPTYLETYSAHPYAGMVGQPDVRLYHVGVPGWRVANSHRSGGAGTRFTAAQVDPLIQACRDVESQSRQTVDARFWEAMGEHPPWRPLDGQLMVSIKGMPGRPGVGRGHNPNKSWNEDPGLETLEEWIGADVDSYRELVAPCS